MAQSGMLVLVSATLVAVLIGRSSFSLPYPCQGSVHAIPAHKLPRPATFQGHYAVNNYLQKATRLFDGQLHGAESVHVGSAGQLHMIDKYGNYVISKPNASGSYSSFSKVAYLGPSRPLGFTFDKEGNLIVCDATIGLTMLEKTTGKLVVLSNEVSEDSPFSPGARTNYANDIDIARDGTIYFTTSTDKPVIYNVEGGFLDTFHTFVLDLLQGSMTGRLLSYSPTSRRTHVLAEGFWYTNGVAVAPDQSFVAFAETNTNTVHKYWLTGLQKGITSVLITNLPGFPDGVSVAADGNFWITLAGTGHQPLVKLLPYRWVRFLLAWLPASLKPAPKPFGAVVKVSPEGQVVQWLMDPDGSVVSTISSVTEDKDRLYFGNVAGNYVSFLNKKSVL